MTAICGAFVGVVAIFLGRPGANACSADVTDRTGVFVVTNLVVGRILAPGSGNTTVGRTGIAVITNDRNTGFADPGLTDVVLGARISVVTRGTGGRFENTAFLWIARVGRTGIAVVTHQGPIPDTRTVLARIGHSAWVVVVTSHRIPGIYASTFGNALIIGTEAGVITHDGTASHTNAFVTGIAGGTQITVITRQPVCKLSNATDFRVATIGCTKDSVIANLGSTGRASAIQTQIVQSASIAVIARNIGQNRVHTSAWREANIIGTNIAIITQQWRCTSAFTLGRAFVSGRTNVSVVATPGFGQKNASALGLASIGRTTVVVIALHRGATATSSLG